MVTTTTSTIELGLTPEGQGVNWHLANENGPLSGIVTGRTGAGATTALNRVIDGAIEFAITTWHMSTRHTHTRADHSFTDPDTFTIDLKDYADPRRQGSREPLLVVVDDLTSVSSPRLLAALSAASRTTGVGVVVRTHTLALSCRPDLGSCQYLVLGILSATEKRLATRHLDGYAAPRPAGRTRPGQGVYSHRGRAVPLTVTPPLP